MTEIVQAQNTALASTDENAVTQSLLQLAIENKVDVGVIERLVALQERREERDARDAYFKALAKFQDKCPPIIKNARADIVSKRTGSKFGYGYASLDHLQKHIRPYLRANDLSYTFDVTADGKGTLIVWCVVRHIDGHSERASFPVPVDTAGERMSAAQANGAALTYGKRQALAAALGLSIEEDTDGKTKKTEITYITEEQAKNLSDLIEAAGVRKNGFLQWLGAESVDKIVAADFQKAVDELNHRIQKNRAGDA